ncbi:MAG: ribonuclease III [Anaerolineae bacterium]|jgi:ribonuclease-3|nr:ribonuclease III [Anaerolineae bacterium]
MSEQDLQRLMGVTFNQPELLRQALTHRSYLNEHPDEDAPDYERLEFLGDAVLDFLTGEMLFRRFPDLSEGELTRLRSALVRMEALADLARGMNLGAAIRMGKGEARNGGRDRTSTLCRVFEALVGALYLDHGLDATRAFVIPRLTTMQDQILQEALDKDARSRLQEWSQAEHGQTPTYHVLDISGPDHERTYTVEVRLNGEPLATGTGRSILLAGQAAAVTAYQRVQHSGTAP